jgi:predicted metal-dependent HD superfamily phosphohydrolase
MATTMTTTRIEDAPATTNQDFRSTSTTLQQLRGYWHRCCRRHDSHHGDEWFHRVWELHTDNSRHYHTAVHLLEMCQLFDAACASLAASAAASSSHHHPEAEEEEIDDDAGNNDRHPPLPSYHTEAILLAIFFHDAVYDATSSRNEEDSAHLFRSFAAETAAIDESTIRDVVDWIMATKTHQVSSSSLPPNPNLQLFLDLDMAVLGKTATAYAHYANLVRREYQHVPLAVYCEKRATVLQDFLRQPHIYGTDLFRTALERRARENLAHEIESLRRGAILGSTASPP